MLCFYAFSLLVVLLAVLGVTFLPIFDLPFSFSVLACFFLHNYVMDDMEIAVKANIKGMLLCFLYDYYFFLYL